MFLDHLTIIVADVDRTRRFYTEQLGLVEVDRPDFDFPGVWFAVGPAQIHATLAGADAGEPGGTARTAGRASRGPHFALRVDDFEESLKRLEQIGIAPVAGPQLRPDGIRQVYITDPDGHVIELCGD